MIPDWRELAHCCRCDLITKKCMTYFSWRISNKMKNGHYVQNASVIVSWFLQFKTMISDKNQLTSFINIPRSTLNHQRNMPDTCFQTTPCTLLLKSVFRMLLCQPHVKILFCKRLVTTYHPSAHLFSLMLLWCYINGLWNSFKPEAFMSCKLNLIGLNFSVS